MGAEEYERNSTTEEQDKKNKSMRLGKREEGKEAKNKVEMNNN